MYKSFSKQANSRATKGMENKTPKVGLRKGNWRKESRGESGLRSGSHREGM